MGPLDPYPDLKSRFRSKRANVPSKIEKLLNLIFLSAGCSLLRVEGFYSLDVLLRRPRDKKNCKIKKYINFFLANFLQFLVIQNHETGSGFNESRSTTLFHSYQGYSIQIFHPGNEKVTRTIALGKCCTGCI
jgi:hypothetical protein